MPETHNATEFTDPTPGKQGSARIAKDGARICLWVKFMENFLNRVVAWQTGRKTKHQITVALRASGVFFERVVGTLSSQLETSFLVF